MSGAAVELGARHLHWTGEDRQTVCGCSRWVPVRAGSRVWREPGYPSFHYSKARRSDCGRCRELVREEVTAARRAADAAAGRA